MAVSKLKVGDIRRINEKRDAFYTLTPLNRVLRLFGLNCIYRDGSVLKSDWSYPKVIFLIFFFALLNAINVCNKLIIWNRGISFSFHDFVQITFLLGYCQYLLDLFFVYQYGRDRLLLYYDVYNYIDNVLGMPYYKDVRRCTFNLLISFTAIVVISIVDFSAWFATYGNTANVVLIIDYSYVLLRNLSFTDAIAHVNQVSYRLRVIGDILKGFYLLNDAVSSETGAVFAIGVNKKLRKAVSRHPRPTKTADQYELLIQKLNGCYLMILEQCDYINSMYGARILGMFLSTLIDMTILLNLIARIVMGSLETSYSSGGFMAISSVIGLVGYALVLFYEVYRCEQGYFQIKRIIRYIDYLVTHKNTPPLARSHLQAFRVLITSRPVQFHAVNFYTLDYKLLLSVCSTVITYTIILLQHMN